MNEEIMEALYDYALKYDIASFRIEEDDLKSTVWSLVHLIYISNKFKYDIKKEIILNIDKYQVTYNDTALMLEGYFTIDQLRDLHEIDDHIMFMQVGG